MAKIKCRVVSKNLEGDMVLECDLPSGVGKERKKRKPSAYNIFMGSCVKGKSGRIQDRFKSCAADWRSKKK